MKEVQESKELMELLRKARTSELSESEKQRMQELLMLALKDHPNFCNNLVTTKVLNLAFVAKNLAC
ncbi:MAG: hypothetical protein U5K54_07170 [Cytophagales bacterium]|nr:hypothetical protein [Cytophagales bacterium]